jgi:hypothetical protein
VPNASRTERALLILAAGLVIFLVLTRILGDLDGDWRPNHFDEWRSLAWAERFLESGTLSREEPVGSPNGLARDISDRNRSLGFVAIYAAWLQLVPQPIAHFKTMVLAFLLLYLGGMVSLLRTLDVRAAAALPAVLAVGAIPTDAMLLGPALAAPSSLSLGLLCFALVAHHRLTRDPTTASIGEVDLSRRRTSSWALLITTATLLALTYPLTLIVFGGLVAVDLLAHPRLLQRTYARSIVLLGAIGAIALLTSEWQGDSENTIQHLSELFLVDQGWHLQNFHVYRLDYLVLPVVLLLALFGMGVSLSPNEDDSVGRMPRDRFWIAAAFMGPLVAYGGYQAFGAGLVVPYQRLGLYLNFGAILCAAVAIDHALSAIDASGRSRWVGLGFVLLVGGAILLTPRAAPPYEGERRFVRPSPALEAAAARIASEYDPPARIFALPQDGLFLEALTGLRVAPASLDSLLTGERPPVLDCEAEWEVVVGRNSCPTYALTFRVDDVLVYERRRDIVGDANPVDE